MADMEDGRKCLNCQNAFTPDCSFCRFCGAQRCVGDFNLETVAEKEGSDSGGTTAKSQRRAKLVDSEDEEALQQENQDLHARILNLERENAELRDNQEVLQSNQSGKRRASTWVRSEPEHQASSQAGAANASQVWGKAREIIKEHGHREQLQKQEDENEKLRDEVAKLKEEHKKAAASNRMCQQKLEADKRSLQTQLSKLETAERRAQAAEQALANERQIGQQKILKLEEEVETLRMEPTCAKDMSRPVEAAKGNSLADELQALNQGVNSADEQEEEEEDYDKESLHVNEEAECKRLRSELGAARVGEQRLREEAEQFRKELARMSEEQQHLRDELARLKVASDEEPEISGAHHRDDLMELQRERDQLKEQAALAKEAESEARQKAQRMEQELQQARPGEADTLQAEECNRLRTELEMARQMEVELRKREQGNQGLLQRIIDLQRELAVAKKQVHEWKMVANEPWYNRLVACGNCAQRRTPLPVNPDGDLDKTG